MIAIIHRISQDGSLIANGRRAFAATKENMALIAGREAAEREVELSQERQAGLRGRKRALEGALEALRARCCCALHSLSVVLCCVALGYVALCLCGCGGGCALRERVGGGEFIRGIRRRISRSTSGGSCTQRRARRTRGHSITDIRTPPQTHSCSLTFSFLFRVSQEAFEAAQDDLEELRQIADEVAHELKARSTRLLWPTSGWATAVSHVCDCVCGIFVSQIRGQLLRVRRAEAETAGGSGAAGAAGDGREGAPRAFRSPCLLPLVPPDTIIVTHAQYFSPVACAGPLCAHMLMCHRSLTLRPNLAGQSLPLRCSRPPADFGRRRADEARDADIRRSPHPLRDTPPSRCECAVRRAGRGGGG